MANWSAIRAILTIGALARTVRTTAICSRGVVLGHGDRPTATVSTTYRTMFSTTAAESTRRANRVGGKSSQALALTGAASTLIG